MVEFEKYTFQLCAVGHLWHLLNKRYLVSIHSRYSCFIFTFQPNVSLAPFYESSRGISKKIWRKKTEKTEKKKLNWKPESELQLIMSVSSLMESVE